MSIDASTSLFKNLIDSFDMNKTELENQKN